MKNVSELYKRTPRPIKVMQFGEGNFLRAFVDYGIDVANEELGFNSNVAIIVPIPNKPAGFAKQDNIYTVCLRGQKDGKPYKENRVVTCVEKVLGAYEDYEEFMALAHLDTLEFIVSNTTEAGIVFESGDKLEDCPPKTYPAKLTKFLYERYTFYQGAADKALTMLPVELIEKNGENLKKCVSQYADLWHLEGGFKTWLERDCIFAGTLVDRIVTGYPRQEAADLCQELGYEDELLDKAEPFGLWVIGDARVAEKLKVSSSKWDVEFTDQLEIFKERKVRILNGAHTSMVLGAYLAGMDYVGQCMADPVIRTQLDQSVFGEIVPTVHMPQEKAEAFAKAVFERFENPFVKHALLSISLNSISKWRARVLPSFKDSLAKTGKLPKWLTYSFAALLAFYGTEKAGDNCLIGERGTDTYEIHDDADKLEFIRQHAGLSTAEYAKAVMSQVNFWGEDLTTIAGFADAVIAHLDHMAEVGAKTHIEELGKQA
ncbi:tagaturonate reductase [Sporomusaceae bacterium BoRhaA]|uniref:tagaturonate reductase n=1 Tax=Pelorhabdus rhamnosifermentans TaxID=2772457 RepID=UPI001C0619B2|nr:tagaturonate reductase [Pelorhabdus rhamnosifermentans]MBU2700748.1 tagaturonate reductase [Pelorhabdus rhamnosifermentans]